MSSGVHVTDFEQQVLTDFAHVVRQISPFPQSVDEDHAQPTLHLANSYWIAYATCLVKCTFVLIAVNTSAPIGTIDNCEVLGTDNPCGLQHSLIL
jgi:hypothetical protein